MPANHKHMLGVAVGALTISSSPAFVKLAVLEGVAPTPVAMWRTLLGFVVLAACAGLARRPVRMDGRALGMAALAGSVFAIDLIIWHKSIVYVGAGMATILGSTQVFWTGVLGRALLGERLEPRFWAAVTVAFFGVALLAGAGSSMELSRTHLAGVALGLATGSVYATFLLALRRAVDVAAACVGARASSHVTLLWVSLFAGMVLSIASFGGTEVASVLPQTRAGLAYLVCLALLSQVVGWLLISASLPRVPAATGGLLLTIQPVFAALWGALCFGETLRPLQLLGGVLTLGGVYLGTLRGHRQHDGEGSLVSSS